MSLLDSGLSRSKGTLDHATHVGFAYPRLRKIALSVGFFALGAAVLVAWNAPADGYELSPYRATPTAFWMGIATALLSAATVCASDPRDWLAGLGLGLGGTAIVTVAGIPLIRNYQFYGLADSLTHLGWAREMATPERTFFDLFYPGTHSTSILLADGLGLALPRAMVLVVTLFVAVYLLFVPLVAYAIAEDRLVAVVAGFSGFMLLPLNNIGFHMMYFPYSLATFFFPVVLFVLVRFLGRDPDRNRAWGLGTVYGALLVLTGGAMLVFHGQPTLNVLVFLGGMVVAHALIRRRAPDSAVGSLPSVAGPFVVVSLLWVVWVGQFGTTYNFLENLTTSVVGAIYGEEMVGETVAQQGESAESIDVSLAELFVKLFLVPAVYSVVAAATALTSFYGGLRDLPRSGRATVACFGFGGLALLPFFAVQFLGNVSNFFFRHAGFAMVLATIVGAVGLAAASQHSALGSVRELLPVLAVVVTALALALSVAVMFPSPYIYNYSHHMDEYQQHGYQTAFDGAQEGVAFAGIRNTPHREMDALLGEDRPPTARPITNKELRANPAAAFDEDVYLPVAAVDYQREVIAYQELRYDAAAFETIDAKEGVHRVQHNGEFDLYYVEGGPPEGEDE